ncbi:MAG: hypothetical protein P4N59_12225 [Negativicutes bacterium]|nr:hypothetical protein [Negativicutes bacterium]
MKQQEVCDLLTKKLELLTKITANTATHLRFVRRHEMVGLKRVLRERGLLLRELAAIDQQNGAWHYDNWKDCRPVSELVSAVAARLREVVDGDAVVRQAAMEEKNLIAARLHSIKMSKNLQTRYVATWHPASRTSRFNRQG